MKGSRRRGGWCVLLRFKRLPRTFVSCTEVHGTIRASLFLSLVVEWAGSPLSFPSIRARVNVSLNPRRSSSYNEPLRIGNTRFSQTRLHSHSRSSRRYLSRTLHPRIPFAAILSHEQKGGKKEGEKKDKERDEEAAR